MAERGLRGVQGKAAASVKPELKRMTHDHVSQVMEIEQVSFTPSWTDLSFHILIDRGCECWILEAGSSIAGYAVCQVEGSLAHILNICVDRKSRGHGYGRKLLDHLLDQIGSGVEYAVLEVRRSNLEALNLYLSSGFRRQSTKPGYYPTDKGREDAILLVKSLC